MTTDGALTATDLPVSIVIVGGGVIGCEFATIYAELGEMDRAFEFMERAIEEGSSSNAVFFLKVFPWYDPLRSDPRFENLLRRMNLLE